MINIMIEENENIAVIHIKGDCDLKNIHEIENIWNKIINRDPRIIAFDCSKIRRIDSIAIALFVKFYNAALKTEIKLILYDLNTVIEELFVKASLNKSFVILTKTEFERNYFKKYTIKLEENNARI